MCRADADVEAEEEVEAAGGGALLLTPNPVGNPLPLLRFSCDNIEHVRRTFGDGLYDVSRYVLHQTVVTVSMRVDVRDCVSGFAPLCSLLRGY